MSDIDKARTALDFGEANARLFKRAHEAESEAARLRKAAADALLTLECALRQTCWSFALTEVHEGIRVLTAGLQPADPNGEQPSIQEGGDSDTAHQPAPTRNDIAQPARGDDPDPVSATDLGKVKSALERAVEYLSDRKYAPTYAINALHEVRKALAALRDLPHG